MKAIIPVAGAGTRLRPHTHSTPKVLIPVAGKPIIGHILNQIQGLPIDEVVMVTGYMGEKIREYVEGNFKLKVTFVTQEKAKGLADAIYLTKQTVGNDDAIIILGDTIFKTSFKDIISKPNSQIGVKPVQDPRRFGVVELEGKRITRLVEKPDNPKTNLAIVGIYLIKRMTRLYAAIDQLYQKKIKTKGEYQLTDALQLMLEQGEMMEAFTVDGWYDCGKPETLLETNRQLLEMSSLHPSPRPGVVINPPVYIDPGARLEHCIIGPYVSIASGSNIRNSVISNTIIGSNVQIDTMMLQNSLLGDNSTVRGKQRRLNVGDGSEVDLT
jgi:glucose-1-phosphate thymidylyltransferase